MRKYDCPRNLSQVRIDMLREAKVTWYAGHKLPRTDLVKELIYAHVVAVQEYDHYTAGVIHECLVKLATRPGLKGASNE